MNDAACGAFSPEAARCFMSYFDGHFAMISEA
jgi:hypothetical protein